MQPTESLRLFWGIKVPEPLAGRLLALCPDSLRSVHPAADVHLTLVFLGDVAVERIAPMVEQVNLSLKRSALERTVTLQPGELRPWAVGRHRTLLGAFPVLTPELAMLRQSVMEGVTAVGVLGVDDKRDFVPHVTLGWLNGGAEANADSLALDEGFSWSTDTVELYVSSGHQRNTDPCRYKVLKSIPFVRS